MKKLSKKTIDFKDKKILGSWITEPNCKFIDSEHIQIELLAHIWYSYGCGSKTNVINKKLCFIEKIYFDELNDKVEILEEKKIPKKLETYTITDETISGMRKSLNTMINIDIIGTINEIIDYLENKK